jgi:HrpA-like RNA helicase
MSRRFKPNKGGGRHNANNHGPSYKAPPWVKNQRGKRRGRGRGGGSGGGRGGGGRGGGGRDGDGGGSRGRGRGGRGGKGRPDAPAYLLQTDGRKQRGVSEYDSNAVGLIDVTVRLPQQYRKDEIFDLSMTETDQGLITNLLRELETTVDDTSIVESELNAVEVEEVQGQPKAPSLATKSPPLVPPPTSNGSLRLVQLPQKQNKMADVVNSAGPRSTEAVAAPSSPVDSILLDYLTNHMRFTEQDARRGLESCQASVRPNAALDSAVPLTSDEREALLETLLDWLCLNLPPKVLEEGFRRRKNGREETEARLISTGQARLMKITSNHKGLTLVKANWKLEARISHFCSFGFDRNRVKSSLATWLRANGDRDLARDNTEEENQHIFEDLMMSLYTEDHKVKAKMAAQSCGIDDMSDEELREMIEDETMALTSIYGDNVIQQHSPWTYTISLTLPWLGDLKEWVLKVGIDGALGETLCNDSATQLCHATLHVAMPKRLIKYPKDPALIIFVSKFLPPAANREITLALIDTLCGEAGQPMLYSVVDNLLNENSAYLIARKHLQAKAGKIKVKPVAAIPVKKTVLKEIVVESDEAIAARLKSERKKLQHLMIQKERQRVIDAEAAAVQLRADVLARKNEEVERVRQEAEKRAKAMRAAQEKKNAGDARLRKLEESGKQLTLRGVVQLVNEDRRGSKNKAKHLDKAAASLIVEPPAPSVPAKPMFQPSPFLAGIVASSRPGNEDDDAGTGALPVFKPSPLLAGIVKTVHEQKQQWPWLYTDGEENGTVQAMEVAKNDAIKDTVSRKLLQRHQSIQKTPQYRKMIEQRSRLPAYEMRAEIIGIIQDAQVVVISGETGCGKTTQVPQIVLDWMIRQGKGAECNMVCTQPRRISAMGVADRIASERVEKVGETVGYQIRLETRRSAKTRLLLCTTGVLLRRLQCDPLLEGVSHIFVDEIHERDLNTDFLLIILRGLIKKRPRVKLVLMSATLNALQFAEYFSATTGSATPIVEIPGRAFPVKDFYLEHALELTGHRIDATHECAYKGGSSGGRGGGGRGRVGGNAGNGGPGEAPKRPTARELKKKFPSLSDQTIRSLVAVDEALINYELIEALVGHIAENSAEGAILIFLPGLMEIQTLYEKLQCSAAEKSLQVFALHSSLSTAEQKAIFTHPPKGIRKVVVATNIAETSITIDDVVYVIDAGRVKENQYDHEKNMAMLVETWVSLASAKQRRGRAGRVQAGVAYHLFSSVTKETLSEYTMPEMHRVPLHEMVLQIKVLDLMGGDAVGFLGEAVTPPDSQAVTTALDTLRRLQAIDLDEADRLTPLGYHLANLPVDPALGKILLYGAIFQCLDPMLTIAAAMSFRSPFFSPLEVRELADEKKQSFNREQSDHLTLLTAYDSYQRVKGTREEWKFLRNNFLSRNTLDMISDMRKQFAELVVGIGFARWTPKQVKGSNGRYGRGRHLDAEFNKHSGNLALYKAVLTAGLYPNVVTVSQPANGKVDSAADLTLRSKTGDECALHPCSVNFSSGDITSKFLLFHERVKTSKVYLRDCSTIGAYPLLLFGGTLRVWHREKMITLDDWLAFRFSDRRVPVLVRKLRNGMDDILRQKIISPGETSAVERSLVILINTLTANLQ